MSENPIVKVDVGLGAIAEPATRLIDAFTDAVGGVFAPRQTRRMAHADADATEISARAEAMASIERVRAEIQASTLIDQAKRRSEIEAIIHQSNMEAIVARALPRLDPDHSVPEKMERDWIASFFDKARIIGDEEMQEIWAKILAGEANHPGSFSKKTLNLMSSLDRELAETFNTLCDFVWKIDDAPTIIDIDTTDNFYVASGIDYDSMSSLLELGLVARMIIGFDSSARMIRGHEPVLFIEGKTAIAEYGRHRLELTFPDEDRNRLWVGGWKLTQSGRELYRLCDVKPIDGFLECVVESWEEQERLSVAHLNKDAVNLPTARKPAGVSILEMFDEIHASVPESAWDDLPTDGAINYKHYLYGWPKVEAE